MSNSKELVAQSRMLTTPELATMLGMSRKFIWKMVRHKNPEKRLPCYKMGNRNMFAYDEVIWWRDKQKVFIDDTPPASV